jgi:signal transduction histidine kinase
MNKRNGKRRFKILIVDDVPKNIQVAANILQQQGYQLFFAQNGPSALEQVGNHRFDLILLDIMMPEMDGFEVCEQLKKSPEPGVKDIPIIFLTARSETDDIVRGFNAGAVDYVTKPFNGPELSARVRTHLALKHSNEKLKELNATKDKFFSIIAHDLRNPLQGLLLSSDMLDSRYDKFGEEKRRDYIRRINRSSHHLSAFLENLLEWSRSQRGVIKFNPKTIDLGPMTDECLEVMKENAEKKLITLVSRVSRNTFAYADIDMIKTVVRNLISNAVKFTHSGGEVTVTAEEKEQSVEISVSDTGVGIDAEHISKLFRLDVQVTTKGTANEKGTGLGLILCKEFVERNSGSISIDSEPGKGSRFTFSLPGRKKD